MICAATDPTDPIRSTEQRISLRQRALRADVTAFRRAARSALTSPVMLFGAFATGFAFGRTTAGNGHRVRPSDETPYHHSGLLERFVVTMTVVRGWSAMLHTASTWFDRPTIVAREASNPTVAATGLR